MSLETMMEQGDIFTRIVPLFFVLIIGIILFVAGRGLMQWRHNNNQPVTDARAKVVGRRTAVRGGGETHAHTSYYVTFELEHGNRVELRMNGSDYRMLAEGDAGTLTYQGTRYKGFQRNI